MEEPRTHYQISLTARQAFFVFLGLLVALGAAFFFGLMSGLSGREASPAKLAAAPERAEKERAVDTMPAVETAVPTARSSGPSRKELAGGAPVEPTVPATLHPFEDGAAEEVSAPKAEAAPRTAAPPARAAAAGKLWVQVASLGSQPEAGALSARLSRHGFHVRVLPAAGPKGKIYRVRVGPYPSDEEAGRAASRLAEQEKIKQPWVVPDGK